MVDEADTVLEGMAVPLRSSSLLWAVAVRPVEHMQDDLPPKASREDRILHSRQVDSLARDVGRPTLGPGE